MKSDSDWWARGIAALGVGTAIWSLLLQWKTKRPSLAVRARIGDASRLVFHDPSTDRMLHQQQIAILGTVLNDGDRDIQLQQAYLRPMFGTPAKVGIQWSSYPQPHSLQGLIPNHSYSFSVFVGDVLLGMATRDRLIAVYRLELNDRMDRWWCSGYFRASHPALRIEEIRRRSLEGMPASAIAEYSAELSRARELGAPVQQ